MTKVHTVHMLTHCVPLDYFNPNVEIKIAFGQLNYLLQSSVDERRVIINMTIIIQINLAFDFSVTIIGKFKHLIPSLPGPESHQNVGDRDTV